METALKGRKLEAIKVEGQFVKVSTTGDVEDVFARLTDKDYPVTCMLTSAAPEAHRLFRLVVDSVYQEKVSDQGHLSEKERERFRIVEGLLRKRIVEEMEEAIKKTLQARGMQGAEPILLEDRLGLPHFHSGEKLKGIIQLVKGDRHSTGAREFFVDLVPPSLLQRAEEVLRTVRASQTSGIMQIYNLLAPCLPFWMMATLLHASLEVVIAQFHTGVFASKLLDLVSERKLDEDGVRIFTTQWLSGWLVIKVWGYFASSLFQGRAERSFGIGIRKAALKALLQQDFEYFDKHSAGSLQGRLHGDAEQLKRHLLGMSREFICEGTAIVANAYLVYTMTPLDMFLVSIIPLPFVTLGQMWLIQLHRKWDKQAHFMREDADSNISQVLGEIKTVRDFAMETFEADKFAKGNEFLGLVEESHASKRNIIGHLMHMLHVAGEAVTIIVGCKKVARGELKAGELVLVMSMLNGMVGGKIRGMIERIRELAMVVEPAGRICELLQATPVIEPSRADHLLIVRDAHAKGEVLAALSESGQVEKLFKQQDEDGAAIGIGSKLISATTASGQVLTITDPEHAAWESCQAKGERLQYYSAANPKALVTNGWRGLRSGHKVRGCQVGEGWVRVADGAYLPIFLRGVRVLQPVVAGTENLANFLEASPSGIYPLRLYFSRRIVPSHFQGRIEFENVQFRYPTELRVPALRDVSFTIEPGQMAALVGHAGCGKSTIFKLIKRLYDPTAGRILLDGRPLHEYDVHHLRRKIAVVAQENVLFDTTLRANVTYGVHPEPSDEDVFTALRQASALDFVDAFPDKIYTLVGNRGMSLSGGQRQRVAIARAMVRKPEILILDEATSALDPVNEKIVQRALDALIANTGATALVIAHRLTTVKDCNKILVFDEGRMVEQGTHDELLEIPVERHAARGKQEQGALRSGYYHSQWDNMMGKEKHKTEAKDGKDEKEQQEERLKELKHPEDAEYKHLRDAEIECLRKEVECLRKELERKDRESADRIAGLQSSTWGHHPPGHRRPRCSHRGGSIDDPALPALLGRDSGGCHETPPIDVLSPPCLRKMMSI
eukprot:gnl/TRDRNA2_/TRDRNA2_60704_c0_seq1.p1 gnl/TRDRNA2_/TRDRNA2_60704_c0~~gnl/TRDRNA2_/TRDRNA2_60704_c0_seq1.p1  ORF type:complete len:1212 (-),score=261.49 gnl/TRDRNA2_/TRDRNA2_60704_c0_seq1:296-3493(-)